MDRPLEECRDCTRQNKWMCDLYSRWVEAGADESADYYIRFLSREDGDWILERRDDGT